MGWKEYDKSKELVDRFVYRYISDELNDSSLAEVLQTARPSCSELKNSKLFRDLKSHIAGDEEKVENGKEVEGVRDPLPVEEDRECFKCHEKGHLSYACPVTKCFNCGEMGHMSGACGQEDTRNGGRNYFGSQGNRGNKENWRRRRVPLGTGANAEPIGERKPVS